MEENEAPVSDPRLKAIMELIKFLSKSEADRAMPKVEAMPHPDAEGAPEDAGEGPGDEELEALKALAR